MTLFLGHKKKERIDYIIPVIIELYSTDLPAGRLRRSYCEASKAGSYLIAIIYQLLNWRPIFAIPLGFLGGSMVVAQIVLFFIVFVFGLFFVYASLISIAEKEKRAALLVFLFGMLLLIPPVLLLLFFEQLNPILIWGVPLLYFIIIAILFFPFEKTKNFISSIPKPGYDERNIMFSRNELEPGSERFLAYYNQHPEKLASDNLFREKPGLMKKGATHYDPILSNATSASMDTVKAFHATVDGTVSKEKISVGKAELTVFIQKWAKMLGAKAIGFTELKGYHKYSVVGRGADYGKAVDLDHKYAIALTVEMDKDLIDTAPKAPVTLETSLQYLKSGEVAVQIAVFLRNLGFEARAHIDGNYRVICPLVARDAGLGNIGRMGLLMTPRQGPRVRIAVVTTNAPINVPTNKIDTAIPEFCRICKKCANTCPSHAISTQDETEIDGVKRWQINQEKCFTYWCQTGTDCGRCIAVCPYSHPDNVFHNMVRFGIRYNPIFRKIAVPLDDIFYGRKPPVKGVPEKISYRTRG